MMIMRRVTRSRQRGVAVIEAMVTLPLLFLFFFAIGEMGRLMYQYNQLNSIVRNTCRYVASQAYIKGVIDVDAGTVATAKSLGLYGRTGGTAALLAGMTADDIAISVSGGDLISVTATYNWAPIFSGTLAGNYGENLDYSFPLVANISMRAIP